MLSKKQQKAWDAARKALAGNQSVIRLMDAAENEIVKLYAFDVEWNDLGTGEVIEKRITLRTRNIRDAFEAAMDNQPQHERGLSTTVRYKGKL